MTSLMWSFYYYFFKSYKFGTSSFYSLLHLPATCSHLGPDILNIFFSYALSLCSSFSVKESKCLIIYNLLHDAGKYSKRSPNLISFRGLLSCDNV